MLLLNFTCLVLQILNILIFDICDVSEINVYSARVCCVKKHFEEGKWRAKTFSSLVVNSTCKIDIIKCVRIYSPSKLQHGPLRVGSPTFLKN